MLLDELADLTSREVLRFFNFAFVEFEDKRDAEDALRETDGKELPEFGTRLVVEFAKGGSRREGNSNECFKLKLKRIPVLILSAAIVPISRFVSMLKFTCIYPLMPQSALFPQSAFFPLSRVLGSKAVTLEANAMCDRRSRSRSRSPPRRRYDDDRDRRRDDSPPRRRYDDDRDRRRDDSPPRRRDDDDRDSRRRDDSRSPRRD
ncbi:hypothetical protein HDU99_003780 [Rhizoclosmatium hyalinum]|nr:hypothetical protein HDU99_003780 [Rhizoclosmatium hyalinum]